MDYISDFPNYMEIKYSFTNVGLSKQIKNLNKGSTFDILGKG